MAKKKKALSFMELVTQTEQDIFSRLEKKSATNAKRRVRRFFGKKDKKLKTSSLTRAVAIAIHKPAMPNGLSKFAQVDFCEKNGIGFVMRNKVASKATNYRADNSVRARLVSWRNNGIIPNGVTVVWASDARVAETAWKSGDTLSHEKVFIVRTK